MKKIDDIMRTLEDLERENGRMIVLTAARAYVRRKRIPDVQRRKRVSTAKKRNMYFRQKGLCVLCGETMNVADMRSFAVDHLVPIAKGGDDRDSNLGLSHASCNSEKGSRDVLSYARMTKRTTIDELRKRI